MSEDTLEKTRPVVGLRDDSAVRLARMFVSQPYMREYLFDLVDEGGADYVADLERQVSLVIGVPECHAVYVFRDACKRWYDRFGDDYEVVPEVVESTSMPSDDVGRLRYILDREPELRNYLNELLDCAIEDSQCNDSIEKQVACTLGVPVERAWAVFYRAVKN